MAYTVQLAAALSGATRRQLGHWRRTGVVEAEHQTETRVYYSYRDIVALRTCVYLRRDASLQRIRAAFTNLRGLGELEHLSTYNLVAHGKTISLIRDDRTAIDLVEHPGQELLAHMADVLAPFVTRTGQQILSLDRPFENVTVQPAIRSGHPVIAGTRIGYELVAGLLSDGMTLDDVQAFYPDVSEAAAGDALRFHRYVEQFADVPAA